MSAYKHVPKFQVRLTTSNYSTCPLLASANMATPTTTLASWGNWHLLPDLNHLSPPPHSLTCPPRLPQTSQRRCPRPQLWWGWPLGSCWGRCCKARYISSDPFLEPVHKSGGHCIKTHKHTSQAIQLTPVSMVTSRCSCRSRDTCHLSHWRTETSPSPCAMCNHSN